jgi:hypothetical protein
MIVKIIPKEGLKVRDPISKDHLDKNGQEFELSAYWIRRELAGEVTIVREKKEITKKK